MRYSSRSSIVAAVAFTVLSGCAAETARRSVAPPPVTVSPATVAPATVPPAPETASSLALRVEPFADFYFQVRAQAAGVVEPDPDLERVVEAWLPVQQEIGAFGGFWRFDLAGLGSTSVEEFRGSFADAPETVPSRAGGTIPIRGPGLAMAAAMEEAWPRFVERHWPERERRLRAVVGRLERDFLPGHRRALRHMLDSLAIADPEVTVAMTLVIESHPPGASTYRSRSGPVAALSIADLLGEGRFSDLEETLLHETCHALDGASRGDQDVFSVLRRRLAGRGLDGGDRRLHDIPHMLMFVQAEATMRRIYDAQHVAYGDTRRGDIAPLYERSGEAAVVVRRLWNAHLDGALGRDEALEGIVDELVGDDSEPAFGER